MHIRFSRFASDIVPSSAEKWTLSGFLLTTPQHKQIDLSQVTQSYFTDTKSGDPWSTKLMHKNASPIDHNLLYGLDKREG